MQQLDSGNQGEAYHFVIAKEKYRQIYQESSDSIVESIKENFK